MYTEQKVDFSTLKNSRFVIKCQKKGVIGGLGGLITIVDVGNEIVSLRGSWGSFSACQKNVCEALFSEWSLYFITMTNQFIITSFDFWSNFGENHKNRPLKIDQIANSLWASHWAIEEELEISDTRGTDKYTRYSNDKNYFCRLVTEIICNHVKKYQQKIIFTLKPIPKK